MFEERPLAGGPASRDPARETVLVTGASSGIGWRLAHAFAADGSRLLLVARRRERLEELAGELEREHGTASLVLPADLSHDWAREGLLRELDRQGEEVDVLVNDAGFGLRGAAAELDADAQLDMVAVNVTALTHLTLRLLPDMLTRRRGGILNLASTAAFQPGPLMAVYYATKAHVLSFTEALAEELRDTGVVATCLAPGPTETPFREKSGITESLLARLGTMDPAGVAKAGHQGFRKGRAVVVPGILNKAGTVAVRLGPRALIRRVVGVLHRAG